jgi:acyl dehydratase
MIGLRYQDLSLGQQLPPVEHQVTQEVIDRAALAHLDFNPVHTDVEWSERAQPFGTPKTVAHGMFTMSLMASVIHRAWQADGAVIRRMDSKFTKPVPVGQSLRCEGAVTELHPIGPGRNAVVVHVTARDRNGDVVGVGDFRVSVPD